LAKLVRKKKAVEQDDSFLPNVLRIAALAAEKKAKDIKVFDLRGLTFMADAFVVCTATSEPQMKAVYTSVKEGLRDIGVLPVRTEGAYRDGWLLMDYGSVVFHVFREKSRTFYDLDGLWGDAPEIKLDIE
jgi:ribosome-associated protein